jgi:hypothetical protein
MILFRNLIRVMLLSYDFPQLYFIIVQELGKFLYNLKEETSKNIKTEVLCFYVFRT